MKKSLILLLAAAMLLMSVCSVFAGDLAVIYTNDVHCGVDENMGYSGISAYKKYVKGITDNVVLVDIGDAIQGDTIGAISRGEYIIDYMNAAGYDLAVLGNHEFDYGMDRLNELAEIADFEYLNCNITYTGSGESKLGFTKPYKILEFPEKKVAFIGVSTPLTITSSTPTYFQEDGEFVYDFGAGEKGARFYRIVQENVNAAKAEGADIVILMTHLGIEKAASPYTSIELINNIYDVDAVLDGHSHSVIPYMMVPDAKGYLIPLSSTGTKLANVGVLLITDDGYTITSLANGLAVTDPEYDAKVAPIKEAFETRRNEVVAHSDTALSTSDAKGNNMIRARETNLGDFCADAYRIVGGAQIGLVNGGAIRADLPAGDITFNDVVNVHPFGNMLTVVKATGQQVIDALEWASRSTQAEYTDGAGLWVGDNGGFLQVSGLKYTIDTSVESAAISDDKGMFFGMIEDVPYRVKDILVEENGEWVPIDPEGEYSVASHSYLLKNGGDGTTMFMEDELLIDGSMSDYQMLLTYITDILGGHLGQYAESAGRITVK